MRGTLRWISCTPGTSEFNYDIASKEFDTEEQSLRDTLVHLLTYDWDTFGEPGDTITVEEAENAEEVDD